MKLFSLAAWVLQTQSFSNDEHSPEPMDLLRFSPLRSNRYSMPFVPPGYSSTSARKPSQHLCVYGAASKYSILYRPPVPCCFFQTPTTMKFIPMSCCDRCHEESSLHHLEPRDPAEQLSSCSQFWPLCAFSKVFVVFLKAFVIHCVGH